MNSHTWYASPFAPPLSRLQILASYHGYLSVPRVRRHNVLPIVMGAHPTDYARSAPYRSYIHVDEFESPKELAEYLHRLDRDDDLYNSYFRWKGTGEFINTYFWCRVCAMLHDDRPPKYYKDVNEWWRGDGVCTASSWREHDLARTQNTWGEAAAPGIRV